MVNDDFPQRKGLFWDTDPTVLDVQKNSKYIVERILDFGNDTEVRWLFKQYPLGLIKEVVFAPRNQLHKKSKALWTLLFSYLK